jgi:dethiobiotin synthetase
VVTAAVAALASARGDTVAVVKPAQTGVATGEPGDLAEVRRLAGVRDTHELARFPDPLSPEAAARVAGLPPLDLARAARDVADLAAARDLVLVEGAGGLLVRYHPGGATLANLACQLAAPVLVVTTAGLGTLNHTALTLEALAGRDLALAGLVIGSWPDHPGLADRSNVADLEALAGAPLSGALPAGAGRLGRDEFCRAAAQGLAPSLGGHFDPAVFREEHALAKELT